MKSKGFVSVVSIFCAVLLTNVAGAAPSAKQAAWTDFRAAYLKRDFKKIARLSAFPIEVKGTMDDDPIFKVSEAKLATCLALHYDLDAGENPAGLNKEFVEGRPNLADIKDNGRPISAAPADAGFRIANLVFAEKTFKLQRFYVETAEPEAQRACR